MRTATRTLVTVAILILITSHAALAADGLADQLRSYYESSRKQMLEIAEAMPEDKYGFRPTDSVRSFGEIVAHFAAEMVTGMELVGGESKAFRGKDYDAETMDALNARYANRKTKAELVKSINEAYDYGTNVLKGLDDTKLMQSLPRFHPPFLAGESS
jgi:hypothetical protein